MSDLFLFFDTETTGIPRNYNAPVSDLENWPRLVQIGWVIYDKDENLMEEAEYIIKPDGFSIPESVSYVHGITTEIAERDGIPLDDVLVKFSQSLSYVDTVIGHNLSFDDNIVGAEFLRCSIPNPLDMKQKICTMKSSTGYCKIPGPRGDKWPRLHELFFVLFHQEMGAAHTALMDIKNTAKCYFELRRIGIFGNS